MWWINSTNTSMTYGAVGIENDCPAVNVSEDGDTSIVWMNCSDSLSFVCVKREFLMTLYYTIYFF